MNPLITVCFALGIVFHITMSEYYAVSLTRKFKVRINVHTKHNIIGIESVYNFLFAFKIITRLTKN